LFSPSHPNVIASERVDGATRRSRSVCIATRTRSARSRFTSPTRCYPGSASCSSATARLVSLSYRRNSGTNDYCASGWAWSRLGRGLSDLDHSCCHSLPALPMGRSRKGTATRLVAQLCLKPQLIKNNVRRFGPVSLQRYLTRTECACLCSRSAFRAARRGKRILTQACREDASCGTTTYNHVIISLLHCVPRSRPDNYILCSCS
jgi:hypothetical protein